MVMVGLSLFNGVKFIMISIVIEARKICQCTLLPALNK